MTRVGAIVEAFTPCVQCDPTPGFVPDVHDATGRVYVRCPCWLAHQQKVIEAAQVTRKTVER